MDFAKILPELRSTGDHSDLVVECGELTFNVHKCIVCLRSEWFANACKAGRFKEGETKVIALKAIRTNNPDRDEDNDGDTNLGVDENTDKDKTRDNQDQTLEIGLQEREPQEHRNLDFPKSWSDEELDFSCDDPEAVSLMLDYLYEDDYKPTPKRYPVKSEPSEDIVDEDEFWHPNMKSQRIEEPEEEPEEELYTLRRKGRNMVLVKAKRTPSPPMRWNLDKASVSDFPSDPFVAKAIPYGPSSLAMHAKLYAMGTKYGIPLLKSTALMKFIAEIEDKWNAADFAEAISIGFTSTAESDRGLRDTIISAILNHSPDLTEEREIEMAIHRVEGLAYDLFRMQSSKIGKKSVKGSYT